MTKERLDHWVPSMWSAYRTELLTAGLSPEAADANIARNMEALFVNGQPNEQQHFFDCDNGTEVVGGIWLAPRLGEGAAGEWFVYDIVVAELLRRQGYGRAILNAAEAWVVQQGGTALSLNVWGHNHGARQLYLGQGYHEVAIAMTKPLV
jgi:GNAT superfamily N-acetyltransferase